MTLQTGKLGHWQCWAGVLSITTLPRSNQPKLNHVCPSTHQLHWLLQIKGKTLGTEVMRQELSPAYRHSHHPQSLQGRDPCPWTSSQQKFMNISGATFMPAVGLQRLCDSEKAHFAMKNLSPAVTAWVAEQGQMRGPVFLSITCSSQQTASPGYVSAPDL